jgi:hypothetical protein
MKDFTRMYVIKNGAAGGWTNSTRTTFTLTVENDYLSMVVKDGRDPFTEEINTAFGHFIQDYEQENGKVELFQRVNPYRFTYRQGSSGCQTTFIEIDKGDGYPSRKRLLDQSCFGKCGSMCLFVYDFLDLCVADGFFTVGDGTYVYAAEEDEFGKELEMQVIRPRLTQYEDGWTQPGEIPDAIVSVHDIVREVPVEAESESEPEDMPETE